MLVEISNIAIKWYTRYLLYSKNKLNVTSIINCMCLQTWMYPFLRGRVSWFRSNLFHASLLHAKAELLEGVRTMGHWAHQWKNPWMISQLNAVRRQGLAEGEIGSIYSCSQFLPLTIPLTPFLFFLLPTCLCWASLLCHDPLPWHFHCGVGWSHAKPSEPKYTFSPLNCVC